MQNSDGIFWADRLPQLKTEGKYQEIIVLSQTAIPVPASFSEIRKAYRQIIRLKQKSGSDYSQELKEVYYWAVVEDFFQDINWRVVELEDENRIAIQYINSITVNFSKIGYKNLRPGVLQSEVKWMIEKWGEPLSHYIAKDLNQDLYKEIQRAYKYERSLIDKRIEQRLKETSNRQKTKPKSGCFVGIVVLCLIGMTLALKWAYELRL